MNEPNIQQKIRGIKPETSKHWDDLFFAKLFSNLFRDTIRYNRTIGEWMCFTGKVWNVDTNGLYVEQKAKKFQRELFQYCPSIDDDDVRQRFIERVNYYGRYPARATLIKDSREGFMIDQTQFDLNPDLYNTQNGVFDLNTFKLRPHKPTDLLSKISNVYFDPGADPKPFTTFINQIMDGNMEEARFLQTVKGYSMNGRAEQECFFVEYGKTTRNGKGTLNSVMLRMHGDYGISAQPETVQQKRKDSRQASGDIARLYQARYVNIAEPDKMMRLDAGLLKQLSGRDPITARHLHQSEFQFVPSFTVFMNTNFLPYCSDPTLFDSDRIYVVPFKRHFDRSERDPHLKEKLTSRENISAAFNWCLEGLARYKQEGLNPPDCIMQATEEYRLSADEIGHFIAEKMERAQTNTTGQDAFECYCSWCVSNLITAVGKREFFDRLRQRGMMSPTATVNGRTQFNVIQGYQIVQ